MSDRPDPAVVLDRLKGFQRDTVEYAFQRLYLDEDSTHRFLVADEVGLGKTLVARGVVAKVIDRLWNDVERIDVVYICSNANIARQNIERLTLPGCDHFALASRITLLPMALREANRGPQQRINFLSFTPGTSFNLTGGAGVVRERVLLYWLLREAWGFGPSRGPINVFQAYAGKDRFRAEVERFPSSGPEGSAPYDADLANKFRDALAADTGVGGALGLRRRFEGLCERFAYSRTNVPKEDGRDRDAFVGTLRTILARCCLASLQPDLVILDEFQRFRDLLDESNPASELARDLFNYADESSRVRVLLLSATPYKMYTLSHELEEDNHYEDFLNTVRFLEARRSRDEDLQSLLQQYRQELYALGQGRGDAIGRLNQAIEARLRRVMVRTERLRVDGASDGMLRDAAPSPPRLTQEDVRTFTQVQRVARELEQPEVVEFWKSSPYLFNFMGEYELKRALLKRIQLRRSEKLRSLLVGAGGGLLLRWADLEGYARLDPGNARLRSFHDDLFSVPSWETLWLPPSAPYYPLEGPFREVERANFTKRLVFSTWTVVPRAVTTLTSYEAERRIFHGFEVEPKNTPEARERRTPLLMFTRSEERLTGMPVLGALYPSSSLARLGDPLQIRQEAGRSLSLAEQLDVIRSRVRPVLLGITASTSTTGIEDERWYWAAPLLLDLAAERSTAESWLTQPDLAARWSGTADEPREASGRWAEHVEFARATAQRPAELGRPPADLLDVMALMALAGPSTVALRSFARLGGDPGLLTDVSTRNAAARIGWSFRSLFNQPESMAILRAHGPDRPYWRRMLEYAADGCLQAVIDEYGHLLRDFEGLFDKRGPDLAEALSAAMTSVIALRTSNLVLDEIEAGEGIIAKHERRLRTRFAMRLGTEKSEGSETEGEGVREDLVRSAFNSPFWPFALVTTSIGQEGLDFHPYCHAVVHWNLPANPVDLEQREGRVHRFKGHAIRKNVSRRFGERALQQAEADPWECLFDLAVADGNGADRGLSPYWVYPVEGGAFVERHTPCLPLSRETFHLERLRRSLAVYRLVFGQPRQDDLMAYLLERVGAEALAEHADSLRVSLAPPAHEKQFP